LQVLPLEMKLQLQIAIDPEDLYFFDANSGLRL
jgi:hypothetical protein